MSLTLNDDECEVVERALKAYLPGLRQELVRTDQHELQRDLALFEKRLNAIHRRLCVLRRPRRITASEVMRRLGEEGVTGPGASGGLVSGEPIVFVDARSERAWDESYEQLPGAIRIPVEWALRLAPTVPRAGSVVVYCTSLHEKASAEVAEALREAGHPDVLVLIGGMSEWIESGYPTEAKGGAWSAPTA